jgi:Legionella pneumophila major outer membrane protein precursor
MQLTQKIYRWAALAAMGMFGMTLLGASAEGQMNYRQGQRSMAGYRQPMQLAQTPAPPPAQAAQPQQQNNDDSSDSPFADDPESVQTSGASGGNGLWQPPPELPTCNSDGCQSCFQDACCPQKCGCWYGGADYLLGKAHFSQGYAAIICQTTTNTGVTPNTSTTTDTAVPFPFRNTSMFRAFMGYHLTQCGGDINFTYWNLQSTAATTIGPADVTGATNIILGQAQNNPADGQFLNAQAGVRVNLFDIDFSKYLIYGGPGAPGCCPRWDMRWFAGARIAQVNRFDNNQVTNSDGSATALGMINANFYGAGPKVGLQIRRYIGESQRLSVYAKGSMSLLLGQFHGTRTQSIPGDTFTPTSITSAVDNTSRVIPVTDIEVGGSYQVMPSAFISAGYFVQAWWDLGYGETIGTGNGLAPFGSLDTSNIMAWTGLFVRAELFF